MLLIDKLTNIVPLKSATAIMYVKKNAFYVQGHFPNQPVMPGVLIVEAFGQAAAALTAHGIDPKEYENKLVFLMGVDKARFRNPVIPDCELHLEIEAIRSHGRVWKYKGTAKVEGKRMADAEWSATIVDRKIMIHKSSVIDKKAKIDKNVKIGPFCYVGPDVELKENVELVSNVHVEGNTSIGNGTKIFPYACIGTQPQDLKYNNEKNSLSIGQNNIIREYVTINPGTEGGGTKTKIGNNCLFMISSHVAHDCIIGNNVIIANNVPLGGHVTIEDSVVIGGNSAVQQFTRIGRLAMIGGMTGVLKDVIPFGLSIGNRNYLEGLNLIGLRRKKYDNKKIIGLDKAYKEIFSTKNLHENLKNINGTYNDNELVGEVIKFIEKDKKRPICLPKN